MDTWNTSNNYRNDLNRSFSAPNVNSIYTRKETITFVNDFPLIKREYFAQEIYQEDDASPRILRQYSHQELHSAFPLIDHSLTQQSLYKFSNTDSLYKNMPSLRNEEPMEVDKSPEKLSDKNKTICDKKHDLQYQFIEDSCSQGVASPRKFKENDECKRKVNTYPGKFTVKKELPEYVKFILLTTILAALVVLISYVVFDFKARLDIESLENDLSRQTYEQRDAVHSVINTVKYANADGRAGVQILNFVGRTGVGKTHIANIVKYRFLHSLVNDLHSSHLNDDTVESSVINNLYSDYCNLIIIDDLTVDHLESLINFATRIDNNGVFVIVIAIFNIQRVDNHLNSTVSYEDIPKIHKAFDKTKLQYEVVVFDEFNTADAREWLGKQLYLYDIDIQHHNRVVNRILDFHDIDSHGFKGLHSKMLTHIKKIKETEP